MPKKQTQIYKMPVVKTMMTKSSSTNIHPPFYQKVSALSTSAGRRAAKSSISANYSFFSSHFFSSQGEFSKIYFLLKYNALEAADYATKQFLAVKNESFTTALQFKELKTDLLCPWKDSRESAADSPYCNSDLLVNLYLKVAAGVWQRLCIN